jgi:catechol 2,3-dioxygenase-like lactoylglutathione lyase family enzyme
MKVPVSIILVFAGFLTLAQPAPASGEFSNPTIQIGVVVSNLEKSVDFYTNVIGMTRTGGFGVSSEKAKDLGLTNSRGLEVTVLKLEDSRHSNEWKLMSFNKKPARSKQKYINEGTGMQYITIFVKNIQPFIDRIKEHDVKILSGVPSILDDGRGFILVQDPDGIFIELIGPQ